MLKVAVREPLQSKLERPEDWWQVCVNLCVCVRVGTERGRQLLLVCWEQMLKISVNC